MSAIAMMKKVERLNAFLSTLPKTKKVYKISKEDKAKEKFRNGFINLMNSHE